MSLITPDMLSGNVIKTRIRLARNLQDYPFKVSDESIAKEIVKKVNRALVKCDTFNLYFTSNLSSLKLEAMKERHLISQNLIDNKSNGAALINQDETVSIMINEEDVIREQCFIKGLHLKEAFDRINAIDDELAKNLPIAFDKNLGYLTACPTNVGTGLRASVMLFLPALTESGKINQIIESVSEIGLTVRGLYGEGSNADGYIYQVSNEVTLGLTEQEILKRVEDTVIKICEEERYETERIFAGNDLITMDRAKKSFGILTNAVLLSYSEFLERIADVKLGAMLGMINIQDITKIDDLIISVRPANLCEQYGKKLSEVDRDLFRAEFVGKKLIKMKE